MKRFLSVFISFVLAFAIFFSVGNFVENIGSRITQVKQLNEDAPTEQQIKDFKSRTKDKCFYYYDNLSADEKYAYITMYYRLFQFDDKITLDITEESIGDIFLAVLYDNPNVFWVELEYEYTNYDTYVDFCPKYRLSGDKVDDIQKELDAEIDKIMSNVNELNTDYEKELYIHDYVIDVTYYDMETLDEFGDSVYSSLISGRSICEGYARAVQILLDEAGIYNYLVTGDAEFEGKIEPHMWNIVNIDGNNYHLDATWDDLNEQNDVVHFYFNVTDEFVSRDRKDIKPENNNCNSTKANYFVVENSYVSSFDGFKEHINRTAKELSQGEDMVEFYFENSTDYRNAISYLDNDNGFFNYISSSVNKSGRNLIVNSVDYYLIDDYNYLCIVFKEG